MSTEFDPVARALRSWPEIPEAPAALSSPSKRLIDAARDAASGSDAVGPADLAVLLRHVLRTDAEVSGHENGLEVPRETPWLTGGSWHAYGLEATSDGDAQRVFARPWHPDWVDAQGIDPVAAAYRGSHLHSLGDVRRPEADPFLTAVTGLTHYRSVGQREAIRAVIATPPTATIIGNLPTGTGKSLVAYVPALLSDTPGTTVVVVPTTSLALDQERAFCALVAERSDSFRFPSELAYHGDLDQGSRQLIRERIANGSQPIVFTSPESLMQSLSTAVYTAAERGFLRGFVIDEAHIVSQWGAEFRPAFQALAGTRADLLDVAAMSGAPFRTILLTATLTEESLLTLQGLFGRPGPTELISSVALRDEPSYWLSSCRDEDEQVMRVLESLRHLPRPLVLYTTRVVDAKNWIERLRAEGYRRVMLVAGETDAASRREAIQRLRVGSLDLIVGTSAFGLGVDQPDMRAVVHACVPETVDRYYQEVGRGGRDGNPSVAMLHATPRDRAVADGLARRRLISLDRGFERWYWMHLAAEDREDQTLRLPLSVSPPDIAGDTSENRAWNVRTLLLMDRGGLITLEAAPPPRRDPEESDEEWEARAPGAFEDYSSHAIVRICEGALADQLVWERAVGEARREAVEADRTARRRMDDALRERSSLCGLFADTYTLTRQIPGIPDRQLPVPVAASCGGCPGCRSAGIKPHRIAPATPLPARSTSHAWSPQFQSWFGGQSSLVVLYDRGRDDLNDLLLRALQRLARQGMWCLAGPEHLLRMAAVADLRRIAPGKAIFHLRRWDQLHAPVLPTALMYEPNATIPTDAVEEGGPHRVVLVAEDALDPRHGTALLREYHPAVTRLDDLLERT